MIDDRTDVPLTTGGSRPLIGLSAYREQAVFGVWNTQTDLLNSLYARSVEAAGGIAVLRATRCAQGSIVGQSGDSLPHAGDLTPVKARIELMFRLAERKT